MSSTDALKMRKELSQTSQEGHESPIIKSLFDIKGNSKFKNQSSQDKSEADSSEDADASHPEESKKPSFISAAAPSQAIEEKKIAFANPFVPKTGASSVFTTGKSLWSNPFGANPFGASKLSADKKESSVDSGSAPVPAWLKSAQQPPALSVKLVKEEAESPQGVSDKSPTTNPE